MCIDALIALVVDGPDRSWVLVLLGGGHTELRPQNRIYLTRSTDRGRTWFAMRDGRILLPFQHYRRTALFHRTGPTCTSPLMTIGIGPCMSAHDC